ncbi:DNA topology modulation protein [Paenibacillus marinisediminis]
MKKVMIIGPGGSGKSTFARRLGEITHLPVHHLDAYNWKPGWIPMPKDEWDAFQKRLVEEDEWIIDGNYGRTLDIRMARADTIIFFDLPRYISVFRACKRRIQYHGKTRPDLNEGCPERLSFEFIKWIWNYKKEKRPEILNKLEPYSDTKNVIIFRTLKDVNLFLENIQRT